MKWSYLHRISENTEVMSAIMTVCLSKCHLIQRHFSRNLQSLKKRSRQRRKRWSSIRPNNPTGVVYSEETIEKMAEILEKKQKEFGTDIYLIRTSRIESWHMTEWKFLIWRSIMRIRSLDILTVNRFLFRENESVILWSQVKLQTAKIWFRQQV